MLSRNELVDNFANVVDLRDSTYRFEDAMPAFTYHYYLRPARDERGDDLLVVSQDRTDDDFALLILEQAGCMKPSSALQLAALPANAYGFSTLLLAPHDYHGYFKGRLDAQRKHLVLCLPVHRCEFSGEEPVDEFFTLRRDVVPTLDWKREVHPKIVLRFDNPKTGGGTGDPGVFADCQLLQQEIDGLDGVTQGFIEITNYKGSVVEILSPAIGALQLIRDRNDADSEMVDRLSLDEELNRFLTS